MTYAVPSLPARMNINISSANTRVLMYADVGLMLSCFPSFSSRTYALSKHIPDSD
jgi:hypothetical protein